MGETGSTKESEVAPLAYAAGDRDKLIRPRRSVAERVFVAVLISAALCCIFYAFRPWAYDQRDSRRDLVKSSVAGHGEPASAVNHYRLHMGRYPAALVDLTTQPAGTYDMQLVDPLALKDPWNNPYQYQTPGVHNRSSYDLWSAGPDGVSGTADDIGNW